MAVTDSRKRFMCFRVENDDTVVKVLNLWVAKCGKHLSETRIEHTYETDDGYCVFVSFHNWLLDNKDEALELENELIKIAIGHGCSCSSDKLKLAS